MARPNKPTQRDRVLQLLRSKDGERIEIENENTRRNESVC